MSRSSEGVDPQERTRVLAEQRRERWDTPERRHSWIESDRDLQCPACHRIHAGECAT